MVVFLFLIIGITSFLVYLSSKSLPSMNWDLAKDKSSAYECGYSDLSELGCLYSLQFYVISLSFMIFDLEVLLIIPILVSVSISMNSLIFSALFLLLVMILLFLEIKVSVLEW